MNLNDQALDDNTTKAVAYEHKGVLLAQLPLGTVDQDQTSTTLNNQSHNSHVWHSFNNQYAKISAHYKFWYIPQVRVCDSCMFSPQQLQLAHKHLKKNNLQWNLQFGSKLLAPLSSTKACFKKLQHI
jgi:hypothetical protein